MDVEGAMAALGSGGDDNWRPFEGVETGAARRQIFTMPWLGRARYLPHLLRHANESHVASAAASRPRRGTCFNNAVSAINDFWAMHGMATEGPMSAASFNRLARERCHALGTNSVPQLAYEERQR